MELRRYADAVRHLIRSPESRRRLRGTVQQSLLAIEVDQRDGRTDVERQTDRWNREWLAYLAVGWSDQLTPAADYPGRPPLPADPLDLLTFSIAGSPQLVLYADREHLDGKRVMEIGCGCANVGKMVARYASFYVGVDYSTLALKIARLVSPENCAFVHFFDEAGLARYAGTIDTVMSRFFWIHQNLESARRLLGLVDRMLAPGGVLYCDFYWPSPNLPQSQVLDPSDAPLAHYPSATFAYERRHVDALVEGTCFEVLRETVHEATQRRYVLLRKRT